jgi:sugar phosphate isomerase/epimerase
MKIGFLTACLPNISLPELLKWGAKEGFQMMELAAWPIDSSHEYKARQIDPADFTNRDADGVKKLFRKYDMGISAMAYYDNNLDPDPKKREFCHSHLKKVIDAAALLGVPLVGTFVGGRPDRLPSEIIKEAGEVFRGLVKYAEDNDVKLMIENCPMEGWQRFGLPGNYAYSPELWDALFNEVPSESFGLNLDPSHLYWQGIDYIKCVKDFGKKIFHTHAKDTELLSDGMNLFGIFGRQLDTGHGKPNWWRYRIPGKGEIDWKRFIAALEEVEFDGTLSIEHEDPVFEGSEEKIKRGLVYGLRNLSQLVS